MKRERERKRRERGGKCEPSRYTKAEKTMLHRSSPPRSFETRVESERRLTGTESHQSRRAGLRGVEHAETQTDGARGGRRRRAHALGRARRAAGHVPESSAHGRAEKNVSVIRGVEITHCVRSRRGIRAIVSRSRLRLVGSTLARVRRFASSSRASSPPHRASARPREESRVAESLPRATRDRSSERRRHRARPFARRNPAIGGVLARSRVFRSRASPPRAHAPTLDKLGARSITGCAGTPPTTPIARRRRRGRLCRSSGRPRWTSVERARVRASERGRDRRRARGSSDARRRGETRARRRDEEARDDFERFLIFERDELLARERRAR